jgi:hypothetical protein
MSLKKVILETKEKQEVTVKKIGNTPEYPPEKL